MKEGAKQAATFPIRKRLVLDGNKHIKFTIFEKVKISKAY
jgi:hypothetical protein